MASAKEHSKLTGKSTLNLGRCIKVVKKFSLKNRKKSSHYSFCFFSLVFFFSLDRVTFPNYKNKCTQIWKSMGYCFISLSGDAHIWNGPIWWVPWPPFPLITYSVSSYTIAASHEYFRAPVSEAVSKSRELKMRLTVPSPSKKCTMRAGSRYQKFRETNRTTTV